MPQKSFLKNQSRRLRKNMPTPEVVLWQKIRKKQLGAKFRRQHQIGNYILDFYCPKKKLAIEIDGETHFTSKKARRKDNKRDEFLAKRGIKVLRFINSEVMRNLEGVIKKIKEIIEKR